MVEGKHYGAEDLLLIDHDIRLILRHDALVSSAAGQIVFVGVSNIHC